MLVKKKKGIAPLITRIRCKDPNQGGEPSGGPAGGSPHTKDTTTQTKELTMDDLKGIVGEIVKTSTKEEVDNLKEEIVNATRKSIFPHGDFGTGMQAVGDNPAIVDTAFFHKSYKRPAIKRLNAMDDGSILAKQLVSLGGPFKRLSPELETFAKIVKCNFQPHAIADAGINIKDHNEKCREQYKAAGMSEGVAADGGVLVPVEYVATVIEFATAQSPILSQVWRLPMNSNTLKIPRLVQAAGSYFGGITLYWTDEGGHKTKTKPQLEQLTFTANKLIGLIHLTDELIADSMINIINYITGLFSRAFQYEMERMVISGSGSGQPLGIVNDPSVNIVARTSSGAVSYEDVANLDAELDENFRDLVWLTRKKTQVTLRALRDNNQRPIFMDDYATFNGQTMNPKTMISYPVYTTRNVPDVGSQGDLVLGDLGYYIWCVRQEMTIDSSIHNRFEYDETTYRFVARVDGKPGVSIAFAILNDATS
jgi:HK97 family phage major capsid protein